MINDLFLLWIAGMFVSMMINLFTMDKQTDLSRFIFNIAFWPIAVLILSFNGMMSYFRDDK